MSTTKLRVPQGETFSTTFPTQYDFSAATYSARCKFRLTSAAEKSLFSLTTDVGGGIELLANGDVKITISSSASDYVQFTSGRNVMQGLFDIEIINDVSGEVDRIVEGRFTLLRNITRDNSLVPSPDQINISDDPIARGLVAKTSQNGYDVRAISTPLNSGLLVLNGDGATANPLISFDVENLPTLTPSLDDYLIVHDNATDGVHKVSLAGINAIEKSARIVADNSLQASIDSLTSSTSAFETAQYIFNAGIDDRVDDEVVDRAAEDAILLQTITANEANRQQELAFYNVYKSDRYAERQTDESNRLADQATLQSNIDSVQSDVDSNENTAASATAAVNSTLSAYVTSNDAAVVAEQNSRAAADSTLQNNIDAVQTDVDSNESAAATQRTNDLSNQSSVDSAQDAAIVAEQSARQSAVTTLQNNIDAVQTDVDSNESAAATQRTNDIAQFNSDYMRKAGNHDETITGMKTYSDVVVFNDNVIFSGNTVTVNSTETEIADRIITLNSDEQNTPTQSAGIEVHRGPDTRATLLFDETADVWTAGLVGSTDTIVLQGNLDGEVSTLNSSINSEVTNRTTAVSNLQSDVDAKEPIITKNTAFNKDFGVVAGSVSEGNHTHTEADITDLDKYTQSEVDTGFASLTTSNSLSGNLILDKASPVLTLQHTGSKITNSLGNLTYALRFFDSNNVQQNQMSMSANNFVFDSNMLIDGDLTIDTNGNSTLELDRNGNNSAALVAADNFTQLKRHDAAGVFKNQLLIRDTYSAFELPCHGVDSTNANSFPTRGYINTLDDENVKKTGSTMTAPLTATKLIVNNGTSVAVLDTMRNGVLSGRILDYGSRIDMGRIKADGSNGGVIRFNDSSIALSQKTTCEIHTVVGDGSAVLTTKSYVDDNANVVQAPAAYSFVMPSNIPGPNDTLAVDNVTGTVVTMKWV